MSMIFFKTFQKLAEITATALDTVGVQGWCWLQPVILSESFVLITSSSSPLCLFHSSFPIMCCSFILKALYILN